MNIYLRVVSLAILILVAVYIIRWLYNYYFKPLPGDSISIPSNSTFIKNEPVSTMTQTTLGTNISITRHGAFSLLLTLNSVVNISDQSQTNINQIISPLIAFYRVGGNINIPVIVVAINKITNDVGLLFYDTSKPNALDDPYYVPITTARVKDKTALLVQMLPDAQSNDLQLAVYVDGMFVESRGVPSSYNIPTSTSLNIISGSQNGIDAEIQTVRVWTDSRGLTTADMIATSEDPLNSKYQSRT
jgi:hypothetical protein